MAWSCVTCGYSNDGKWETCAFCGRHESDVLPARQGFARALLGNSEPEHAAQGIGDATKMFVPSEPTETPAFGWPAAAVPKTADEMIADLDKMLAEWRVSHETKRKQRDSQAAETAECAASLMAKDCVPVQGGMIGTVFGTVEWTSGHESILRKSVREKDTKIEALKLRNTRQAATIESLRMALREAADVLRYAAGQSTAQAEYTKLATAANAARNAAME